MCLPTAFSRSMVVSAVCVSIAVGIALVVMSITVRAQQEIGAAGPDLGVAVEVRVLEVARRELQAEREAARHVPGSRHRSRLRGPGQLRS